MAQVYLITVCRTEYGNLTEADTHGIFDDLTKARDFALTLRKHMDSEDDWTKVGTNQWLSGREDDDPAFWVTIETWELNKGSLH